MRLPVGRTCSDRRFQRVRNFPFEVSQRMGIRKRTNSLLILTGMLLLSGLVAKAEGVLYFTPGESGWESLLANVRKISILAPQVFTVNKEGQVTGAVEDRVRKLAAEQGIRLMPLLVNEQFSPEVAHRILGDAKLRQRVISDSLRLCRENGCWGLQLDFEKVLLEDKGNYVQFVREAASAFRPHKLRFSVVVPPPLVRPNLPPEASNRFLIARTPYDLREIGRHVDLLTLMTYDENTSADSPGPIASYDWVEQSIRYALRFVPRQKLFMGLGFYGRQWCNQQVSESSFLEVASLAAREALSFRWHPVHRSPWLEFEGEGCRSILWFENSQSLAEKLQLVQKHRLAGFSAWRLGQEDPAFWRQIRERPRRP